MKMKSYINFKNKNHEIRYFEILSKMKSTDCHHRAVAYLIALANLVPNDVFNFEDDVILPNGLSKGWQTSSTLRATRLMFNLWNGWAYEYEPTKTDKSVSSLYSVYNLFHDYEYAPYFYEAVRISFEWD